jgi:hypothetical protein
MRHTLGIDITPDVGHGRERNQAQQQRDQSAGKVIF